MTHIQILRRLTILLVLLAASVGGARAQVASAPLPPTPKIVRSPTIPAPQQPSFWGVNTNLQGSRDRLQHASGGGLRSLSTSGDSSPKSKTQ
jgi:hypothetical protein